MLNQYVNLSPQQRMAQMLQQQQQTQLQGDQPQMPQAQNPMGGAQNAMSMYGQMQKQNEMQDYMARMKASNGMADMAAAGGGNYTANNGT
jgi:hypothetical protein